MISLDALTKDRDRVDHDGAYEEADDETNFVRPYTLTGGRTEHAGVQVSLQATVCQNAEPDGAVPALAPVEADIWIASGDRISAAEISARLDLPVGVVRVLVGDLATAGLVELGLTVAKGDAKLLRRLIDGVRAL